MIQKPIVINIESESGIKITKIYINIWQRYIYLHQGGKK